MKFCSSGEKAKRVKKYIYKTVKKIRSILTIWVAAPTLQHLHAIRLEETALAASLMERWGGASLVEIGGGVGWQAAELESRGYKVTSYDISSSNYKHLRNSIVKEYDGKSLPEQDNAFDLCFSSNVLEHIPDTRAAIGEQLRVLKSNGHLLHILPSSSWRFWTSLTDLVKKFYLTGPHGEHSKNIADELLQFSRARWCRRFEDAGLVVIDIVPGGIFYTGNLVLDARLSIKNRKRISKFLGSSCNYYLLKPRGE